jgi:hypothetical protein
MALRQAKRSIPQAGRRQSFKQKDESKYVIYICHVLWLIVN